MKKDNFEDILKSKFEDHTMTPPPSIMLNIEKELANIESIPLSTTTKMRSTLLWSSIAAAASLLIGVLLLNLDSDIDETLLVNTDNKIEEALNATNISELVKPTELITQANAPQTPFVETIIAKKRSHTVIEPQSVASAPQQKNIKVINSKLDLKNKKDDKPKEKIKNTSTRDNKYNTYTKKSKTLATRSMSITPRPRELKRNKVYTHISSNSLASTGASNTSNDAQAVPYMLTESKGGSEGLRTDVTSPKDLNHNLPISIGAHVGFNLTDRLSLESGLVYSRLNSSYETKNDNNIDYKFEQKLDYLGIPLSLRYKLLENSIGNLYAKGGAMVERAISAQRKNIFAGDNIHEKFSVKGVQTSVNLSLGGELKFLSKFGIFLEPGISYYFDNNQPDNYRTKNQLAFNLSAGLRFLIN